MSPVLGDDGYFELQPEEVPESWKLARRLWEESFVAFCDDLQQRLPFLGVTPLSQVRYLGVPRQEVDVSPEAMAQARSSLDDVGEHYGTSGELESRGYWMKLDVQSDHRDAGETQA